MDDNFDQILNKLESKVTKFTEHKNSTYTSSIKKIGNKINVKFLLLYITPFIVVSITLYIWKPSFVSNEVEDDLGQYNIQVSFNKLVLSSLIIGAIIDVLIFLYLRKKK